MEQRREFIRRLAVLGAAAPVASAVRDPRHSPRRSRAPASQRPPHARRSSARSGYASSRSSPIRCSRISPPERCTPRCPSSSRRRRRRSGRTTRTSRRSAGCSPASRPGSSWARSDSAEGAQRARLAGLARDGLRRATDPSSPDFLNFTRGRQPLVDAAFLAHAMVRAPGELLGKLDAGNAPQPRRRTALDAADPAGDQQLAAVQRDGRSGALSHGRAVGSAARGLRGAPASAVVQGRRRLWRRTDAPHGLLQQLRDPSDAAGRPSGHVAQDRRVEGDRERRPSSGLGDTPRSRSGSSHPKGPSRRSGDRSPIVAGRSSCSARWRSGTICRMGCDRPRCAAR